MTDGHQNGGPDVLATPSGPPAPSLGHVATTGLRTASTRGVAWNVLGRVAQPVVQLAVRTALARLLPPAVFGTMSTARAMTSLAGLVAESGISSAVVQRPDLTQRQTSAAFWTNLALNLLVAGVCAATAGWSAAYFGQPALAAVLPALGITFVLTAGASVHTALLERRLRIRELTIRTVVSAVAGGAVSLVLARMGWGLWSLVWGALATTASQSVLIWIYSRWRPSVRFTWADIRPIVAFSAPLALSTVLGFLIRNGDNLIVARVLGPEALGQYDLAYALFMFPLGQVTGAMSGVLLPALSAVQSDMERLRRGYLETVRYACLLGMPVVVLLCGSARSLVPVVFGASWDEAGAVLELMLLPGLTQMVGTWGGTTLVALGKPGKCLQINLLNTPSLLLLVWLGAQHGLRWVPLGLTVHAIVMCPCALSIVLRQTGVSVSRLLGSTAPGLIAATGAAVPLLATRWVECPLAWPPLWLALRLLLGVLGTLVGLVAYRRGMAARDLLRLVRQAVVGRSERPSPDGPRDDPDCETTQRDAGSE